MPARSPEAKRRKYQRRKEYRKLNPPHRDSHPIEAYPRASLARLMELKTAGYQDPRSGQRYVPESVDVLIKRREQVAGWRRIDAERMKLKRLAHAKPK